MKSMRKIFVTLIAVVLAACCMFTFCACGEKPADPTGGVTLSPTPGAGDVGGATDTDTDTDDTEFDSANSSQNAGVGSTDTPSTSITPDPTAPTEGLEFRLNADGKSFRVYDYVGEAVDVYIPYTYMNGEVALPVTEIGYRAFAETDIQTVNIPETVTKLGDYAFRGCNSLTGISIPAALVEIPVYAFADCRSLESITVSEDNTKYKAVSNCLIEGNTLVLGCKASVIPDDGSVTAIGEGAFRGSSAITTISIPEQITSIGNGAFMNCTMLNSITLPDAVTELADNIFDGCSAMESFTIKNTVTKIGYASFRNCTKLGAIDIPLSVSVIGEYSFAGCSRMTSLTFHESVYTDGVDESGKPTTVITGLISIGGAAFQGCELLSGEIVIPSSVSTIGANAFQGCAMISKIHFTELFRVFDSKADADAADEDGALIVSAVDEQGNTVYVAPFSYLNSIGRAAFYGCSSLKSINIPYTVEYIGTYAFYGCVANGFHIFFSPLGLRATWESSWNYVNHIKQTDASGAVKYIVVNATTASTSASAPTSIKFAWKYLVGDDNKVQQLDWTTFLYKAPDGSYKEYVYSETMPTELGMYWHYSDETGAPVAWAEFEGMTYSAATPSYPGVYWHYVQSIPTKWSDEFAGWVYSETVPAAPGAYWHYDVENKPVAWDEFDGWTFSESEPVEQGSFWHYDSNNVPVAWPPLR